MRVRVSSPRWNPKLVGAALLLGSLALAYVVGQWVLSGTLSALGMKLGEIGAIIVALAILIQWRRGILLFLVWLTLEDLIRKYAGNDMRIYFVKDALIAVVYGAYMVSVARGRDKLFRPGFWVPLVALFTLGLAQVFNPRTTSLFYGVLGMKLYFYYVPLMFLGYSLLRTDEDLDHFLSFNMKIAAVVGVIGIIQALGWRTFLNPANLAPALQELGHLSRWAPGMRHALSAPPSVFVSQGRYSNFLMLMFTLALAVLAFRIFRRKPAKLEYLTLGVLGVAIFLSGSKGTLVYSGLTVAGLTAGLLWGVRGQPWITQKLGKMMRRGFLAMAAGFCLMIIVFPNLTSAWGTYYYDLLWPDSSSSELGMRIGSYPLTEFEKATEYADWMTGYGTGTASLGVQYVTSLLHAPPPAASWVENGYADLMIEMGILGPILWALMSLTLCISAWKQIRKLAATPYYPVGLAILWFVAWVLLPLTWGSLSTYDNYVVNAYLWTLVGVLYRLPSLAAEKAARLEAGATRTTQRMETARVA